MLGLDWQIWLLGLLLIAAAATALILRRTRVRGRPTALQVTRGRLESLAKRACEKGVPVEGLLSSGIYVHLSSTSRDAGDPETTVGRARRALGTREVVRFDLEDMIVAGHPVAVTFYDIAGTSPEDLPPAGVSFLIAPELLLRRSRDTLSREGLEVSVSSHEGSSDDESSGGGVVVWASAFGKKIPVPTATLFAEAAAGASPIEMVARDEAHRLRAELSLMARRAVESTREEKAGLGEAEDTLGISKSSGEETERLSAWVFGVPTPAGLPEAWVLVGDSIASIARIPGLLAAAIRSIGCFSTEREIRVQSYREDLLIVSGSRAEATLLASARKRARLFMDGTGRSESPLVFLDEVMDLEDPVPGGPTLTLVHDRFFEAAAGAALARLHGDPSGSATARAMMRLSMQDLDGARAHLEEAAAISPVNGEILLALGTLLNEMGEHAAAEAVLRRAVDLDLENPATNNNLGVAYQGLGRLIEAQIFFEKAASIRPDDAVARVNLGRALLDSGDVAEAEHSFNAALERDPGCVPAMTGLVLVAVREGDLGLARMRLGTAMRRAPTDEALLRLHTALYPEEQAH